MNAIPKYERDARDLTRRAVRELPTLLYIGGPQAGRFYEEVPPELITQKILSWIPKDDLQLVRKLRRVMSHLRKIYRFSEASSTGSWRETFRRHFRRIRRRVNDLDEGPWRIFGGPGAQDRIEDKD